MSEWLEEAGRRLAARVGEPPDRFALGATDADALLDLARIAAHESGERKNAPLLAYLVGLAHARSPGTPLEELTASAAGAGV